MLPRAAVTYGGLGGLGEGKGVETPKEVSCTKKQGKERDVYF